jgi:putative endonuclease
VGRNDAAATPSPHFAGMRSYSIYILASHSGVLYVGVTNDLIRRIHEHRAGLVAGFTRQYRVHRVVYYETSESAYAAIAREKQIKGWRREKKVRLIESVNPGWAELLPEQVAR